jgi:hypothetical protein
MGNVDLPYLHIVKSRGKAYTYYRRDGQRLKIVGAIGSPAWIANYKRIHDGFERGAPVKNDEGSIGWWLDVYLKHPDFLALAEKTRKGYLRYADLLMKGETLKVDPETRKTLDRIEPIADQPIEGLTPAAITRLRDRFAGEYGSPDYRPSAANGLATFLRLFVGFASGKRKKLKTGDGHRPGEEDEIALFRRHHPEDTLKRVAFELALNTGQRGGDVLAMGREHMRGDEISVKQEKTGERVWIPMTADLKAVLLPWMKDRVGRVLVHPSGRPISETYFRHMMRDAYEEAGLPSDFTTHGLRYSAATRIFEVFKSLGHSDVSAWEHVSPITGHATTEMVKKYTAKKRKARLAIEHLDTALRRASVKPGGQE